MIKIDKTALRKSIIKFAAWIVVLALLVLLVLSNCDIRSSSEAAGNVNYEALDTSEMSTYDFTYQDDDGDYRNDALDYDGYKVVYDSNAYQLLYHPLDASIMVRDKNSEGYEEHDYSTGYMWTSTVDLSKKPLEKLYEMWRRKVSSLIILHVYDANRNSGAIDTAVYLAGDYHTGADKTYDNAKMSITEIEGGFEVTFAYEKHYIQLSVRIYMKDDVLHVEIPQESIIEQGRSMCCRCSGALRPTRRQDMFSIPTDPVPFPTLMRKTYVKQRPHTSGSCTERLWEKGRKSVKPQRASHTTI